MSSDNIYYEILDYDGSEDRNWFSYSWRSIDEGDFEDVELLLEDLDVRKEELGDLEISLLEKIFRQYDESDLSHYTRALAEKYEVGGEDPTNNFT